MNFGDDEYLQAANEVLARMSPEGRVRFGRYLGQKAKQRGRTFIDLSQDGIDDRFQDPNFLAQVTMQMYKEQPGLLAQLFGGSRRHPRRRHGYLGGLDLSDSFGAGDLCDSGGADGGFFDGFFDCDFGGFDIM